jgi:hypothetical protein
MDYTYGRTSFSVDNNGDRNGVDTIDAPNAVSAADIVQLGNITTLSEFNIQGLLDATNFVANKAATFTVGFVGNQGTASVFGGTRDAINNYFSQRTFLALNDSISGFNAKADAIIEITGYSGNPGYGLSALSII